MASHASDQDVDPGVSVDTAAPTFGLPLSLRIPIAAASLDAIGRFVGHIERQHVGADGLPRALLVRSAPPPPYGPDVPLWSSPNAAEAKAHLHPEVQVWTHVDYRQYRATYLAFGQTIPATFVLDHVQNRRAIRLRNYSHPWLRLCPVDSYVNSGGGSRFGGEAWRKTSWRPTCRRV